jgi:hypothetical protein
MVSLKRRLKQPITLTFVCCGIVGVLGVALIFVGIGGGFFPVVGYHLSCNTTSPARLSCVASWDKYSANSRMYTDRCMCEREYVTYVSGVPDDAITKLDVGARLQWKTRRIYNRTDDCATKFPANEIETPCYWYPLGDQMDNTTAYDYSDKKDFKSSNGVFAVGMLACFISLVVMFYIFLVSFAPSLGCF